jgi:hypothetical protein
MTVTNYGDQLRDAMVECGQPTTPITLRGGLPALRFDALDVDDDKVTFLWLGKPVYMARRNQGHLIHVRGDTALTPYSL